MPTSEWNRRAYAWEQPATYEPQEPTYGAVEPYRSVGAAVDRFGQQAPAPRRFAPGPRRAASQARVSAAMYHGAADAAAFRMYTARPFSQERRDARRAWRRAEEYSIRADAISFALTTEVMLGEFYGDF